MIVASGINLYNSVQKLNELITQVVSDKQNGEKITISWENAVFDLLCFINLAK